ncbi:MAG: hypothetical protein DRJ37_02875 [Thermoprotei archaeon]|nr:MAG: hypothetical protein DRJ37_02875 [Thermoprotei archaeon]
MLIQDVTSKSNSINSPNDTLLENFIIPSYNGLSVLNVTISLCRILGLKLDTGVPESEYLKDVEDYDCIISILIDALGFQDLINYTPKGLLDRIKEFYDVHSITTVAPSTTTTVLASFSTGLYPQQHGLIGYRVYFREYGLIVKLIEYSPVVGGYKNSLGEEGIDPRDILPYKSIFEVLRERGIESYLALNIGNIDSMFTKLLVGETEFIPYVEMEDMFLNMLKVLKHSKGKTFIHAYWGSLDSLGHVYGPDSEAYIEHLKRFLEYFLVFTKKVFEMGEKCLIVLLSDHGQVQVDPEKPLKLDREDNLSKTLLIPPYGDSRFVYFKVKDEMRFLEIAEETLRSFEIYESRYLVNRNIFGLGEANDDFLDRIGDYIAIPKDDSYLLYLYTGKEEEKKLKGRHGGLTKREMIVPLLISKLGRV